MQFTLTHVSKVGQPFFYMAFACCVKARQKPCRKSVHLQKFRIQYGNEALSLSK